MNSAPVGSQSYGSHSTRLFPQTRESGDYGAGDGPQTELRSSEESRILSALVVTRALLPWGYSGSSLRAGFSSPSPPGSSSGPGSGACGEGGGIARRPRTEGPRNPAKPPSAPPGRSGLSPAAPCAALRVRTLRPAEPEPRRKQVGVSPPGAAGSGGARGAGGARRGVGGALPPAPRGRASWTPGSCPCSSAPLPRRLAKPGRPRRYPACRTEPLGPAAHLKSCGRPGRGGEGGGGRRRSSPRRGRERGRRRSARRWPRAGVRARAGAPGAPRPPPAPSLSPLRHRHTPPPSTHRPAPLPAAAAPRAARSERQLPRLEPLAFPAPSARRAEPGSIFSFLPQPSGLRRRRRQGNGDPRWGRG